MADEIHFQGESIPSRFIQKAKELPWMKIALATTIIALAIIGGLAHFHILDHIGSLSSQSIQYGSFIAVAFLGLTLLIKPLDREKLKVSKEQIKKKLSEIRKEKKPTQVVSPKVEGAANIPSSKIKKSLATKVLTAPFDQELVDTLLNSTKGKNVAEILLLLDEQEIKDSCILVEIGDSLLVRGKAILVKEGSVSSINGEKQTLLLKKNDLESALLFYGPKSQIDKNYGQIVDAVGASIILGTPFEVEKIEGIQLYK